MESLKRLQYIYKIINDWVLNFSGEVNQIQDFGEKLSINDLFFLGGDNLRGFEVAGVGPRDSTTDDALGGRTLLAGTAELHFPIGLPEELGFSGAVFTDIGTLLNPIAEGANLLDEATPRVSAGIGVRWRSPFGPIRIDAGFPILKESFDQEELIHFNFGTWVFIQNFLFKSFIPINFALLIFSSLSKINLP